MFRMELKFYDSLWWGSCQELRRQIRPVNDRTHGRTQAGTMTDTRLTQKLTMILYFVTVSYRLLYWLSTSHLRQNVHRRHIVESTHVLTFGHFRQMAYCHHDFRWQSGFLYPLAHNPVLQIVKGLLRTITKRKYKSLFIYWCQLK